MRSQTEEFYRSPPTSDHHFSESQEGTHACVNTTSLTCLQASHMEGSGCWFLVFVSFFSHCSSQHHVKNATQRSRLSWGQVARHVFFLLEVLELGIVSSLSVSALHVESIRGAAGGE